MATTTPNFGWDVPQSTDLVKDGATAIAALGNDIDTSLVDLKGGTTGQVLSKASNTDLDFTWSSVDPLTILDAKGDLISATAADTPARLAVGTNGQVLTANSSASTGLEWTTISSGGMTLLSTTSLTGATTTVSGISTSYNSLQVHIYGVTNATAAGDLRIAPNGTTNISRWLSQIGDTGGNADRDNQSTNGYILCNKDEYDLLRTDSDNYWIVNFPNYTNTTYNKIFTLNGFYTNNAGSAITYRWMFGKISTTSAITSLQFSNSGGNLSTGTVLVYGVK